MAKFRRRRPPRRGPLPFRYVLLLSFVIFLLLTATSFWMVDKEIEPTLMHIAELEATSIATLIIQEAVKDELYSDEEEENLIKIDKDSQGRINTIIYDSRTVNKVLRRVTDNITEMLEEVEKGNFNTSEPGEPKKDIGPNSGIIYEIPLGQVTDNALLSTLGPKIPVRFFLIGDVHTDITESIKEFGINNTLYEMSIYAEVKIQVVIPFATETATIKNTIPVIRQTTNGDVPLYYNENGESTPSIQLPEKP